MVTSTATYPLDRAEATKFLKAISPDAHSHTIQVFEERTTGTTFYPHSQYLPIPKALDAFEKAQEQGAGAFVTPQTMDGTGRKSSNTVAVNVFAADIDIKLAKGYTDLWELLRVVLEKCPLKPHIIVFSGHGFHLYWLVETGIPLEFYSKTQKNIQRFFKAEGADSISDPARVLRIPGSWNLKEKPVQVKIHELSEHPRYNFDSIKAAFPEPKKPKRRAIPYTAPSFGSDDYREIYDKTLNRVEEKALTAGDGFRHSPAKDTVTIIKANGIRETDSYGLLERFCSIAGMAPERMEKMWQWAKENLNGLTAPDKPSSFYSKGSNRKRPFVKNFLSKEDAQTKIYDAIKHAIESPTKRFTLMEATTGLGKSKLTAQVLKDLDTMGQLPLDANGKPLKGIILVPTKELALQTAIELGLPNKNIYKGRAKENCSEHDLVKNLTIPSSACISCLKKHDCNYQKDKKATLKENLVIAAKQSFLNNSGQLEKRFDYVIIDEGFDDCMFNRETLTESDLKDQIKALEAAEITEEQRKKAIKYIKKLGVDLSWSDKKGRKRYRKKPPVMPFEAIEKVSLVDGKYFQPKPFWSLLAGKNPVVMNDYEQGQTTITVENTDLIDSLNRMKVICLDATPNDVLLKRFSPEKITVKAAQNYRLYQGSTKLRKSDLKKKSEREKVYQKISKILRYTEEKSVIFCHKAFEDDFREMFDGPNVEVAVYGRDSKGTNRFMGTRNIILAGLYTPNIDAMNDIAAAMKVKADRLTQQKQDAEITQVIGRARAVHKLKPVNIFMLSNYNAQLEKKAVPLDVFFSQKGPVSDSEAKAFKAFYSEVLTSKKTDKPFINNKIKAPRSYAKQQLEQWFNRCISRYGFYSPDLLGFGSQRVKNFYAPQNISEKQLKRYMPSIIRASGKESHVLTVGAGRYIRVWGDLSKAVEMLTPSEDLKEAQKHVRRLYNKPFGATRLQFLGHRLKLGVDTTACIRSGDYSKRLWALVLWRTNGSPLYSE